MRTNRFALYLIPLLGIAAIPQILFFWLAPEVQCYITVYVFGTVITAAQLIVSFVMWMKFGTRKSAAVTAVGSGITLAMLLAGGILLATGATVRTAIYCLAVISVIYVAAVTPLILSVLDAPAEDRQTPSAGAGYGTAYNPEMPDQSPQAYSVFHRSPTIAERYAGTASRATVSAPRQQTPPPLPERR